MSTSQAIRAIFRSKRALDDQRGRRSSPSCPMAFAGPIPPPITIASSAERTSAAAPALSSPHRRSGFRPRTRIAKLRHAKRRFIGRQYHEVDRGFTVGWSEAKRCSELLRGRHFEG